MASRGRSGTADQDERSSGRSSKMMNNLTVTVDFLNDANTRAQWGRKRRPTLTSLRRRSKFFLICPLLLSRTSLSVIHVFEEVCEHENHIHSALLYVLHVGRNRSDISLHCSPADDADVYFNIYILAIFTHPSAQIVLKEATTCRRGLPFLPFRRIDMVSLAPY